MSLSTSPLVDSASGKWRLFSIYGINRSDRVERAEHFLAAAEDEAIRRARLELPYFHKVEVWERSSCLFQESRSADRVGSRLASIARFLRSRS